MTVVEEEYWMEATGNQMGLKIMIPKISYNRLYASMDCMDLCWEWSKVVERKKETGDRHLVAFPSNDWIKWGSRSGCSPCGELEYDTKQVTNSVGGHMVHTTLILLSHGIGSISKISLKFLSPLLCYCLCLHVLPALLPSQSFLSVLKIIRSSSSSQGFSGSSW